MTSIDDESKDSTEYEESGTETPVNGARYKPGPARAEPELKPEKKKFPILKVFIIFAAAVAATAAVLYFFVLPVYAGRILRDNLGVLGPVEAGFRRVTITPLKSIALHDFTFGSKDGAARCEIKKVRINIPFSELAKGSAGAAGITLYEPDCELKIECAGECVLPPPFDSLEGSKSGAGMDLPVFRIRDGTFRLKINRRGRLHDVTLAGFNGESARRKKNEYDGRLRLASAAAGGVSLKNIKAGYTYRDGKLFLKGLRGDSGGGGFSAAATVDFAGRGIPYSFEATLNGIGVKQFADELLSVDGVIDGKLNGTFVSEGTVASLYESDWRAGLRMPRAAIMVPLRYGVKELRANDFLPLKNMQVVFNARGARGEITVDAFAVGKRSEIRIENSTFSLKRNIRTGGAAGVGMNLVMTVGIDKVKRITDAVTGVDMPFDGNISAHFALSGYSGDPDSYKADGIVVFTKGFIIPAFARDAEERKKKKIQYKKLKVEYFYGGRTLDIERLSLEGDGIDFRARGSVKMGGAMNVKGKAELAPALADRIFGWPDGTSESYRLQTLPAGFVVSGATGSPIVYWKPPEKKTPEPAGEETAASADMGGAPAEATAAAAVEVSAAPEAEDKNVLQKMEDLIHKVF